MRVVNAIVENLDLKDLKNYTGSMAAARTTPKMMLRIILYACMNNVYSCRGIEKAVQRDIHYLAGGTGAPRLRDHQPLPQQGEG